MAKCAGCKRTDQEIGSYGKENPVTEDGSYFQGGFVCDECYIVLIGLGLDVGAPQQLQLRASLACKPKAVPT